MELTNIKDIFREKESYAEKEVTVGGWVRSNRDSKNFGFLVVNDGSFFEPLQVVYSDALEDFDAIAKVGVGAAVTVTGKIVVTPGAKQPLEMQAREVVVEGITLCRRSGTALNICVLYPICGRGRTLFRQCLGCVLWRPLPSISFSRREDSSMCIPL